MKAPVRRFGLQAIPWMDQLVLATVGSAFCRFSPEVALDSDHRINLNSTLATNCFVAVTKRRDYSKWGLRLRVIARVIRSKTVALTTMAGPVCQSKWKDPVMPPASAPRP